jgi:GntR family transcriptional regulator
MSAKVDDPPVVVPTIEAAPDPLYLKIYSAITSAMSDGTLKPGNRLPPERAFCEQFGVSRATVRRAMRRLAEDGLVEATVGRGSFVSERRFSEPPNALMSFTELAAERGLTATAQVLQHSIRPVAPEEAAVFGLNVQELMFELERVRLLDKVPVALDRTRIPLALAPSLSEQDFSEASVYAVLEASGAAPVDADITVSAAVADDLRASALCVAPGHALLVCTTVSTDVAGRPVEISEIAYRADRYQFRSHVARRSTAP